LFKLPSDSRKFTIFAAAWGRNPEPQMHKLLFRTKPERPEKPIWNSSI